MLGREEGDHTGDLFWLSRTSDRRMFAIVRKGRPAVLVNVVEDVGHGIPRSHRIYANAMANRLHRECPGELRKRALRRGIGRDRGECLKARIRAHIDDGAAPIRDHGTHRLTGVQEDAPDVDGKDAVPIIQGHVHHQLVDDDTCIVDEDVQLTELLDGRCYGPSSGTFFRHVADEWDDAGPG